MPKRLFVNNWKAILTAELAMGGLSLSVDAGQAAKLVGLGTGDYYLLTLVAVDVAGAESGWEIVKVTAQAGGVLTIVRGQEGTAPNLWPVGSRIEARLTAGDLSTLRDAAESGGGGGGGIPDAPALGLHARRAGAWLELDSPVLRAIPRMPVGEYLDNVISHNFASGQSFSADQVKLAPWVPLDDLTIDQLSVRVTTAQTSGEARVGIYSATADGWPADLLTSVAGLAMNTTGEKTAAITPLVLEAGKVYWLAFHASLGGALDAMSSGPVPLGGSATSRYSILQKTIAFSSGLPASWTLSLAERSGGGVPILRMRRSA